MAVKVSSCLQTSVGVNPRSSSHWCGAVMQCSYSPVSPVQACSWLQRSYIITWCKWHTWDVRILWSFQTLTVFTNQIVTCEVTLSGPPSEEDILFLDLGQLISGFSLVPYFLGDTLNSLSTFSYILEVKFIPCSGIWKSRSPSQSEVTNQSNDVSITLLKVILHVCYSLWINW